MRHHVICAVYKYTFIHSFERRRGERVVLLRSPTVPVMKRLPEDSVSGMISRLRLREVLQSSLLQFHATLPGPPWVVLIIYWFRFWVHLFNIMSMQFNNLYCPLARICFLFFSQHLNDSFLLCLRKPRQILPKKLKCCETGGRRRLRESRPRPSPSGSTSDMLLANPCWLKFSWPKLWGALFASRFTLTQD